MKIDKRCASIILCVSIWIFPGCRKSEYPNAASADVNEEDIVCPFLYQKNDSIANALNFIGAPEENLEIYISSIKKTGELASSDILKIANKYLNLGTNKNASLYISMLSQKTKKQLNNTKKNGYLLSSINAIKEGTFHKNEIEYKCLATFSILTKEELDNIKDSNYTQTPVYRILFFCFYWPKYMLIGDPVYFIKENGSYKIVSGTISKDKLEAFHKKEQAKPKTQQYGIASYKENDNTNKNTISWKYNFEIAVRPEDTVTNTFEMLKLTEIIEGRNNIDLGIAMQVLIKKQMFDKYKYKQLNFTFNIGHEEPGHNFFNYGQRLSGWDYEWSIASYGEASSMYYIGQDILNIQTNKNGDFIESDLELMSFESEKDGIRYKNRVLLRKTHTEP